MEQDRNDGLRLEVARLQAAIASQQADLARHIQRAEEAEAKVVRMEAAAEGATHSSARRSALTIAERKNKEAAEARRRVFETEVAIVEARDALDAARRRLNTARNDGHGGAGSHR